MVVCPGCFAIKGRDLRVLSKLRGDYPGTDYLFMTECAGPATDHTVRKIVTRTGERRSNAESGVGTFIQRCG